MESGTKVLASAYAGHPFAERFCQGDRDNRKSMVFERPKVLLTSAGHCDDPAP
jgi:hypothetical protein